MSITLDTLELPAGLTWSDRWSADAPLAVSARRRLDGGLVIYPRALNGGRAITLIAGADQPLTLTQAEALRALAAANGAYTLALPDQALTASVRFRWEDGSPLDLALLIDYADPAADDPVIGTIKLMTL